VSALEVLRACWHRCGFLFWCGLLSPSARPSPSTPPCLIFSPPLPHASNHDSESSASAFGSAAVQAGGGFSFPVTPPTHEEEEVHEAHAERVFSTWASSHSRTTEEVVEFACGGAGSDDEGGC